MKTIRRVFLAGKITGNDWRRSLVQGDLTVRPEWFPRWRYACVFNAMTVSPIEEIFPIREKAILSMLDYVGPYYVQPPDGTCPCDSGQHNHGTWESEGLSILLQTNMHALRSCDLVFAWLDDASASATLYEIGYATALGKPVLMAGPHYLPELGLIYHASEHSTFGWYGVGAKPQETPHEAFVRHLARLLHGGWGDFTIDPDVLSPIESRFLVEWNHLRTREPGLAGLFPQYPIDGGRYRLDFAYIEPACCSGGHGPVNIAIELDGLQAHSSTDQIAADRRRQREIEALGWRVIRFGAKEVYHNAEACVSEVRSIMAASLDRAREQGRVPSVTAILDDTPTDTGEVDLLAEPELVDA